MKIADSPCAKCGGTAWYEAVENEVHLRCSCGFLKVVYVDNGPGPKVPKIVHRPKLELPRRGTKLSRTLGMVASFYPKGVRTCDLAVHLGEPPMRVSQHMSVLKDKGLVTLLVDGRGLTGGSTWALNAQAAKMLNLKRGR